MKVKKIILAAMLSLIMLFTFAMPSLALTIGETADIAGVYGNRAIVIGKAEAYANQLITLLLLNGDGNDTSVKNILYVGTLVADESGYYEAKFKYDGFTFENGKVNNCTLKVKAGADDITDTVLSATVNKTDMLAIDLKSSLGENEAKAVAQINNLYGVSLDATVMLAAYDENNRLIGVKKADKVISEETDSISVAYEDVPEGFDRIVAFVWESATSLIPYSAQQNVEFAENSIKTVVIHPGSDETKRRFTWYNDQLTIGAKLQYALKADYEKDGFTDENSTVVEATTQVPTMNSTDVSCKAKIENLTLGTEYVYRLGNKYHYSDEIYSFKTYDVENSGKQVFALVTDLHNSTSSTSRIGFFNNAYDSLLNQYPDTQFIVSTGDNVSLGNMGYADVAAEPEQYRKDSETEMANMFAPKVYASVPFASTLGNHELTYYADPVSSVTKWHYNLPNDDGYSGTFPGTDTHGNFWFRNGDVLVVGVNISQGSSGVYAGGTASVTKAYIENAIAENTDAKWKILVTHIPPYAYTGGFGETANLRNRFAAMEFDAFDFDAVFSGHQHGYSRSKQLLSDNAESVVTYTNTSGSSYDYIQPEVVSEDKINHSTDANGYQVDIATDPEGAVHINMAPLYAMGTNKVVPDYANFIEAYGNTSKTGHVYNNSDVEFADEETIVYSNSTCVMVTVEKTEVGEQMKIEFVQLNATGDAVSTAGTVLDTYIINKTIGE